MLLHLEVDRVFPVDPGAQRVIRRVLGASPPLRTRGADPERDPFVQAVVSLWLEIFNLRELRWLHIGILKLSYEVFGILKLSYEVCRPKPRCHSCILRSDCLSARS